MNHYHGLCLLAGIIIGVVVEWMVLSPTAHHEAPAPAIQHADGSLTLKRTDAKAPPSKPLPADRPHSPSASPKAESE